MSAVDKQGRFPIRYFKSELGNLLCSTTLTLTAQHQRQQRTRFLQNSASLLLILLGLDQRFVTIRL